MPDAPNPPLCTGPLIAAGAMLGIGMGGFLDGIVFHQILQVHNMLSAKYPTKGGDLERLAVNLEINMFWDGIFHALTWGMTALGVATLWAIMRRDEVPHSTRTLIGSMFLGWGLFNLVEGIINHHILHLHHVVEGPGHLLFDLAFLGGGMALSLIGVWLIRSVKSIVKKA